MLLSVSHFIQLLRWLSLDIVTGALILLYFISGQYSLSVPLPVYIALGLSVWIIYTVDHLRDASKSECPSFERHAFHKRNKKFITIAVVMASLIGLINIYWLPQKIIIGGSILILFCFVYLMSEKELGRIGLKEVFISLGFGMGIFLYPLLMIQITLIDGLVLSQLVLLAYINLILMAWFERDSDLKDGFYSLVTKIGDAGSAKY